MKKQILLIGLLTLTLTTTATARPYARKTGDGGW